MSQLPDVTFVVAVRNAVTSIEMAIKSALGQRYDGGIQVNVVDDGSTDGTSERLARFGDQISVIRHDQSRGRSAARNSALRSVRTECLAIQDADDFSYPDRLARTAAMLSGEVGIVAARVRYVDDAGVPWEKQPRWPVGGVEIYDQALAEGRMPVPHPTLLMRTELVRSVAGYREDLPSSEDLDLLLRLRGISRLACVDEVLVDYRRPRWDSWRYAYDAEFHRRRVASSHGIVGRGSGRLQLGGFTAMRLVRQRASGEITDFRVGRAG